MSDKLKFVGHAEVNQMKREESLLNLICVIAAAGFLALIVYNFFASGSFISTDGLFFTVVFLVLALSFLSVPAMEVASRRFAGKSLKAGAAAQPQITASAGTSTAALKSAPALKDARGRAMPPDVNRMVAEMNTPPAKKAD